jgi:tRNA pseudouridine13 synthase
MRMDEHQRRFMVSSIQGYMFNRVLERRMNDATYNRLLEGDLAWKHTNRSVFDVDAETAEIENAPDGRIASLEVSPSGPMWGARMTRARGVPGQIENEALAEQDLTLDDLATCKHEGGEGKRRALRERLTNVAVETGDDDAGPFIKVTFELPRGCFATMAMREIMKPGSHD